MGAFLCGWVGKGCVESLDSGHDAVVAIGAEAFDAGELGKTTGGTASRQHRHEIDGLRDQNARDGDDGFLDELFETAQRADRRARMDCPDAARMPSAPSFQEIQRLAAAYLADGNAIGAQAQGRADEIGERGDAVLGPHGDEVGRSALQLARVLDDDDAVRGFRDLGQ